MDAPSAQGLLFDFCGVLYDDTVWRRWLLRLISRMGLHTNFTPFFRTFERDYLADVHQGRREYWEALSCYLASAGLSRGQIDEVKAAGRGRRKQFEASIRPFPGVAATLATLAREGVPLAIACSSPLSKRQIKTKLAKLGLENFIPSVLQRSNESDASSVDFQQAADLLHLECSQIAYVARDWTELMAANRTGLLPVAFNCDHDACAEIHLERFEDVLALVHSPARKLRQVA